MGWLRSVTSFVRSEAERVKSNSGAFISPLSVVHDAQPSDGLECFWGEGCSTSACSFFIRWHGLLHRDSPCDFSHSLTGIWGFSHIQASVYLSHSLCLFLSVWDVVMSVGIQVSSAGFWHVQSAMFSARRVSRHRFSLRQLKFSTKNTRFWSEIPHFMNPVQPFFLPSVRLWLLTLPPTSHGQLTLPPSCLTNSLPLFIQPCSHGDPAESPQTAWTNSLRGPTWLRLKACGFKTILEPGILLMYWGRKLLTLSNSTANSFKYPSAPDYCLETNTMLHSAVRARMKEPSCVYGPLRESFPSSLFRLVAKSFSASESSCTICMVP